MAEPPGKDEYIYQEATEMIGSFLLYNEFRSECQALQTASDDERTGWRYRMEMDVEEDGVIVTKEVRT
jgi:hypothetical protein